MLLLRQQYELPFGVNIVQFSFFIFIFILFQDREHQRDHRIEKTEKPVPESVDKSTKPSAPKGSSEGISSTLAGLFEQPRHPWGKDGSIENTYGMGGFQTGGLLGFRGGMPRLPSFKVKP